VMVVAITVVGSVALTLCAFCLLWTRSGPAVVGVWKGTDEYRQEHFFEFHEDRTLTWWDRDRAQDGTVTTRGPFKGFYRRKDGNTVAAETGGFPSQPLGILTLISANELRQNGGHTMRDGLVYRRVVAE
jgi:hypothetical protein